MISAPPINLNLLGFLSLPESLLQERRWGLWRYDETTRNGSVEYAKVPYTRVLHKNRDGSTRVTFKRTGSNAAKSSEWLTFREAAGIIAKLSDAGKPCPFGIAFMLSTDARYVVVDLDKHRDVATGELTPEAAQIVADAHTLVWQSNSLSGLHVIGLGKKPGKRCQAGNRPPGQAGYELYDSNRFIAMTGITQPGSADALADCTDLVSRIYFTFVAPGDTPELLAQRERELVEANRRAAAYRANPPAAGCSTIERARAYLAKVPPAISGCGGHNTTFKAACKLVEFDLEYADALQILSEWNIACEPEWTNAELKHKLDGAYEHATRGKLLVDRGPGADGLMITDENYAELAAAFPDTFGPAAGKSKHASSPVAPSPARDPDPIPFDAFAALGDATEPFSDPNPLTPAAREAARSARASPSLRPTRCHMHGFLGHPTKKLGRAGRLLCGRWSCVECAAIHKRVWTAHLRKCILACKRPRVFVATIDPRDTRLWNRIRKQISRGNGQHARIRQTSSELLIVATVEFDGAVKTALLDAAALVEVAISSILIFGDTRKPIHTSKKWQLPKPEPSGWKRIGSLRSNADIAEIIKAIKKLGFHPEIKRPPSPFFVWAADFSIPLSEERTCQEGWMTQFREIYERLDAILNSIDGEEPMIVTPELDRLLTYWFDTATAAGTAATAI